MVASRLFSSFSVKNVRFFSRRDCSCVSYKRKLCAYSTYSGHSMHINKEKRVIGWIIRAAVETEQRRRDERGVDTPRRAQPRKAE